MTSNPGIRLPCKQIVTMPIDGQEAIGHPRHPYLTALDRYPAIYVMTIFGSALQRLLGGRPF